MRCFAWVRRQVFGAGLIGVVGTGFAAADSFSALQELHVPTSATGYYQNHHGRYAAPLTPVWDTYSEIITNDIDRSGVINVLGPLGLVIDDTAGVPRVRGLSLLQGENVHLLATGRMEPGFEDVTGQLSVTFRF